MLICLLIGGGGAPIQSWMGGGLGGGGWGVPHPVLARGEGLCHIVMDGGGVPHPVLEYSLSAGPGMGYPPPDLGWGSPLPVRTWDGYPPPLVHTWEGVLPLAGVNRLKVLPSLILRMRAVTITRTEPPNFRHLQVMTARLKIALITARIRMMTGGYVFTRVCLLKGGGDTNLVGGGTYLGGVGYLPWPGGRYLPWPGGPTLAAMGTYLGWVAPTLDGGTPAPRQSSTASTCYAAGNMSLGFTLGGLSC